MQNLKTYTLYNNKITIFLKPVKDNVHYIIQKIFYNWLFTYFNSFIINTLIIYQLNRNKWGQTLKMN